MAHDVSPRLRGSRQGSVAPLLEERAELWSRWDRADRLAAGVERRAAAVSAGPPAATAMSSATVPHPQLTASGDLIDELVAIDAAVVADVFAMEAARARLRATVRAQAGAREGARVLVRSAAAFTAVAVTIVLVGVVR
ncbi:MAG: hypothetical protein M3Y91_05655 [Actinomycetota bacterium]|nr:hypothetical protein [Actinomycetota bacterium]